MEPSPSTGPDEKAIAIDPARIAAPTSQAKGRERGVGSPSGNSSPDTP